MKRMRKRIVLGTGAVLAVVGAGGAVAATQGSPAQEQRQAVLEDAAKELGVEAQELEDALEQALANRIDEAVASGRLTEEHGEVLKERIRSGEAPLLGLRGGHARGFHAGVDLEAAAELLDLAVTELREQLREGKTLAEIAEEFGTAVDDLVEQLVEAAKARLDDAVESGRLTDEQRDAIEETLEASVRRSVEASGIRSFQGPRFRGGPDFHGFDPPAAA
jgi:ribosomal protein S13